jgi:hypothetical protein
MKKDPARDLGTCENVEGSISRVFWSFVRWGASRIRWKLTRSAPDRRDRLDGSHDLLRFQSVLANSSPD